MTVRFNVTSRIFPGNVLRGAAVVAVLAFLLSMGPSNSYASLRTPLLDFQTPL